MQFGDDGVPLFPTSGRNDRCIAVVLYAGDDLFESHDVLSVEDDIRQHVFRGLEESTRVLR